MNRFFSRPKFLNYNPVFNIDFIFIVIKTIKFKIKFSIDIFGYLHKAFMEIRWQTYIYMILLWNRSVPSSLFIAQKKLKNKLYVTFKALILKLVPFIQATPVFMHQT